MDSHSRERPVAMELTVHEALLDGQIDSCYHVIKQLRPALSADVFRQRVQEQRTQGYRLAYLEASGQVVSVAGFRVLRCLAWGKFLYVDDLVTDVIHRSKGHGKALLAWLRDEARRTGCDQLHLDSGVQRKDAHRFYEREGMDRNAFHFAEQLKLP